MQYHLVYCLYDERHFEDLSDKLIRTKHNQKVNCIKFILLALASIKRRLNNSIEIGSCIPYGSAGINKSASPIIDQGDSLIIFNPRMSLVNVGLT